MISTIYYLLNESQDDLKDCRLHNLMNYHQWNMATVWEFS